MLALFLALVPALQQGAEEVPSASVGMPVALHDLVLPGSELEPSPADERTPLVVRIDAVRPHGTSLRYDLVWYGLEAGEFDLGHFLRRKDGSSSTDLPPLPVRVLSLLPPGQVEPHRLLPAGGPWLGGYRWTLAALGLAWLVLLGVLLHTRRRARAAHAALVLRARTSAERLAPLVESALAGDLEPEGRHELELVLIAFWRERLDLAESDPAAELAILRAHPEAGPLFAGLEEWLHRPGSGRVDLEPLLAPYRPGGQARVPVPPAAPVEVG